MRRAVGIVLVAACAHGCGKRGASIDASDAGSAPAPPRTPIADAFREAATRILAAGRESDGAYKKLAYLTDHVGNRIAGSKRMDSAVAWAEEAMRSEGHENVRAEKVMV